MVLHFVARVKFGQGATTVRASSGLGFDVRGKRIRNAKEYIDYARWLIIGRSYAYMKDCWSVVIEDRA